MALFVKYWFPKKRIPLYNDLKFYLVVGFGLSPFKLFHHDVWSTHKTPMKIDSFCMSERAYLKGIFFTKIALDVNKIEKYLFWIIYG